MQDRIKTGSDSLTIGKRRRLLAYTRWEKILRRHKEKGNRSITRSKAWIAIMPYISR